MVLFPRSTADVSAIMKAATAHRVAIIPFGAGTSLEGHIIPEGPAVSIDLSQMNRIVESNPQDLDCLVEAGVHRKELNRILRHDGLFFPVDPGADATIGGMVATRASGTNTVQYGTMADNILGLTIVLADGQVIQSGSRARKSASGYDLNHLFCGSEGTLGIITEARLKLYGLPESSAVIRAAFPTIEDAVSVVTDCTQMGINMTSAELLDETLVKAINDFSQLDLTPKPSLWIEIQGSQATIREQVEQIREIVQDRSLDLQMATEQKEREHLWGARHDALYALIALKPKGRAYITDTCVAVSQLPHQIHKAKEDLESSGLVGSILGHVGDGNFHACLIIDPEDPKDLAKAEALAEKIAWRALEAGGTSTGEHGIGSGKVKFMATELNSEIEKLVICSTSITRRCILTTSSKDCLSTEKKVVLRPLFG